MRRVELSYAQAGPALEFLASLVPADGPAVFHPGDLGWALRFEETVVDLWLEGDTPVAVGMADRDEYLFTGALDLPSFEMPPWVYLYKPVTYRDEVADLSQEDVADRVAVQRAAFERSTFTVERWKAMRHSPFGHQCVEALVRTPEGEPASAVTGWLAGQGKCALIEPMGTHPMHRGHGYGREALRRIGDALAARGASSMSVITPASNVAAVALYQSAGFTITGELRTAYRLQN